MAKVDTLSSLWKELENKHMDDIDVDDYVNRFKKIRISKKKNKKYDRSAKIVSANKLESSDTEKDSGVASENIVVNTDNDAKASKENKEQQNNISSNDKKKNTFREELATKIGAGVFFGVFGVVQLWLLIDWVVKGCLLDVLALHLLPIIIVVALFTVTFIIDIINKHRSKREAAKKAKVVNKLNRSSKKKGGNK